MRIYLIVHIIDLLLIIVSSIQYNQRCTFSSGTCNWNIGRRWQVRNLDDDVDDKVLIAIDGSSVDKENGFTDVITSSWLYLTSSCSFAVRLTFQFSIETEQDQVEVFLINKHGSQISSIGRWKALTQENRNVSIAIESLWQQANITFRAAEEFRIEIEIRHLPEKKGDSTTWFAIDDILIESCPNVQVTTRSSTRQTITTAPWITYSYFNLNSSSLLQRSFFHFRSKSNDSSSEAPLPARLTLVTFILYILYGLVTIGLLILFLAFIISTYRKHCLPSSTSSMPIIDYRYRSSRKKKYNHAAIQHRSHIDQDARTEKTMVTTIRPYH